MKNLPYDAQKLAAAMSDSYYHPDSMSALDCSIAIDWPALLKSTKQDVPEDRLKFLQGMKIKSHAVRGQKAEMTFDWSVAESDANQQAAKAKIEDGARQMLGGFYQMYWPMIAGSPFKNASDIVKVEPQVNGDTVIHTAGGGFKVDVVVDGNTTPTHYTIDGAAYKGTVDLQYVPSPKPVPGDLRRISSVNVDEQIGASTMKVVLSLDYQTVDGFNVPSHVSFNLLGAYSIDMDFTGCSATK